MTQHHIPEYSDSFSLGMCSLHKFKWISQPVAESKMTVTEQQLLASHVQTQPLAGSHSAIWHTSWQTYLKTAMSTSKSSLEQTYEPVNHQVRDCQLVLVSWVITKSLDQLLVDVYGCVILTCNTCHCLNTKSALLFRYLLFLCFVLCVLPPPSLVLSNHRVPPFLILPPSLIPNT